MRSKQSKMLPIAVEVALGDLPVVRPGVPRRAGIGQDDPALQLAGIDVERDPANAVHAQLDRGDAAVQRGPIVLDAGRHADRLAFDVHRDLQQIVGIGGAAGPARQRAAGGDGQRRRSRDAGAGGRLAARRQRGVLETVVPREQREQREVVGRSSSDQCAATTLPAGVDRAQLDRAVGPRRRIARARAG